MGSVQCDLSELACLRSPADRADDRAGGCGIGQGWMAIKASRGDVSEEFWNFTEVFRGLFFSLKRVNEIYIVNYPGNHTIGDSWQRSTAGGEPVAGDGDGEAALRREPQVHRHFRATRGVVRAIRLRELGRGPGRP